MQIYLMILHPFPPSQQSPKLADRWARGNILILRLPKMGLAKNTRYTSNTTTNRTGYAKKPTLN
jgi:hypothetical protein